MVRYMDAPRRAGLKRDIAVPWRVSNGDSCLRLVRAPGIEPTRTGSRPAAT